MLEPKVSIPIALAVATMVYAVHSNATPTMADIRSVPAQNQDLDASRKSATWISAGIVAFTSLIARDPTIFTIGGAAVVIMDFWTRHANAVDPQIGKVTNREGIIAQGGAGGAFTVDNTVPDYYDPGVMV
jgi:hypothetical protein